MDKPISVGDLVMLVRPTQCCGVPGGEGTIFRVTGFRQLTNEVCGFCSRRDTRQNAMFDGANYGYNIARLKRIQPLSELEGEQECIRIPTIEQFAERIENALKGLP